MIRRTFRPPNFRCQVRDKDGYEATLLLRGRSQEAVRELLSRRYTVLGVQPYDFQDWLDRAARETAAACAAKEKGAEEGREYRFRPEIWRELKQYLFELFHGKCAYCEAYVEDVSEGDVEHYRPKRGVTGCDDHPGYYWLAYDVGNLFPACEKCNRFPGKTNRFPVRDDLWARRREEMEHERPLLLNPYQHDPREHLSFLPLQALDLPLSYVQGVTDEGRTSVEVYRLNRHKLAERRGEALERMRKVDLPTAMMQGTSASFWRRLRNGEVEFSAAQLAEANRFLDEEIAKARSEAGVEVGER